MAGKELSVYRGAGGCTRLGTDLMRKGLMSEGRRSTTRGADRSSRSRCQRTAAGSTLPSLLCHLPDLRSVGMRRVLGRSWKVCQLIANGKKPSSSKFGYLPTILSQGPRSRSSGSSRLQGNLRSSFLPQSTKPAAFSTISCMKSIYLLSAFTVLLSPARCARLSCLSGREWTRDEIDLEAGDLAAACASSDPWLF